ATPPVPTRPSSRSPPGTQKIRPAARPHSVRAFPRSLLLRRGPVLPAHHLAVPVANLSVPSPHLARSAPSRRLCLLLCSSWSPFFLHPTIFSALLQSFLPVFAFSPL